ncbi:hypothetical protein EDC30_102244 [Paucimonas lemoignei]|uniref:Lipoprotein n=1 Tax=Paucimonas lemoignei TaxID=29443 RepID=A0A4R3I1M1_PAULE|nr:hypothetical protein [Paucimonas lemoignei]TCS38505.1 hypothetical protein EDC30_102244 [Paucimonas lemoignei]
MKNIAIAFILCASLAACSGSQSTTQAKAEAAAAEQVKETPAYKLAVVEAGEALDPADPRVGKTASVLFDAAQFFNTSEKEISNIAYYHAKSLREKGIAASANDLMLAGMQAFPKKDSPFGKPTLEWFNFFGSMYQVSVLHPQS